MKINESLSNMANLISDVAFREDTDLRNISNYGIFHMPELAFAYSCGKEIIRSSEEIFGSSNAIWKREVDLGNGGPTDLVIEFEDSKDIAIEFKLRDTAEAYHKDLNKLNKLDDSKYIRVFCALIDAFSDNLDDGRIQSIESYNQVSVSPVLASTPSFSTNQDWYKKDISCVVGVWVIR